MLEENKILKGTTKAVIFALDKLLKVEANTTSCLMLYQPKAPKALERYKNKINEIYIILHCYMVN